MRVVLKPLISVMPIVGGVQAFFLNNPAIDFNLVGAADILDFPGFKYDLTDNKNDIYSYIVNSNLLFNYLFIMSFFIIIIIIFIIFFIFMLHFNK